LDKTELSSDRSLWDLVRSFELSSYRENLFEQIFCSELLQGCWLAGLPPIEIDRPFVDFQGYDLVATCAGITRHIQLKASRAGQIAVHRNLALKPSACVVNLEATVASETGRIGFSYRFYGSSPGEALNLEGLKAAKKSFNTRLSPGEFGKAERANHVRIPQSKFSQSMDMIALAKRLFGDSAATLQPGVIRWLTPAEADMLFAEVAGDIRKSDDESSTDDDLG
jgi:hypothetical protein